MGRRRRVNVIVVVLRFKNIMEGGIVPMSKPMLKEAQLMLRIYEPVVLPVISPWEIKISMSIFEIKI
jgi:hypothetical protein